MVIALDYLVIGHVTRDLKADTFTVGGTASYAARTARAMGCRVGVVTSANPDFDLDQALFDVQIARFPASATTTFENIYVAGERRQVLHSVAERLLPTMLPSDWRPSIVHVGPVARECDPALVEAFRDAFVGVTPQGWMRRWDRKGRVSRRRWRDSEQVLTRADAVVLSEEDVAHDEALIAHYAARSQLLVVTQGAAGCTVYAGGQRRHFPAPDVRGVDSTGAGDIFAAAFFVWLHHGRDPWTAARFANCLAAHAVTRAGLSGVPTPDDVARCRQAL